MEKANEVLALEKKEDADELKKSTLKLIWDLRRIQAEASCLAYWLGFLHLANIL